jgi:murein DD-endopeptidase MepM/ murein hydrolase activator NlpD
VKRFARVAAGQRVGAVGDSGNASGCHRHFEIWTAPGWYEGGEPYDPRPSLDRWAAASRGT